jgi:hypothetical protein
MKYFLLATLFIYSSLFACEVSLPSQIIVLGEGQGQNALMSKNCSEAKVNDLYSTLISLEGRISSTQLIEMMKSKGHEQIKIEPYMVQVSQLRNIIREQLPLPEGVQVKTTRSVDMGNILALAPGDQLTVECQSCLYGSRQSLNLHVSGFDGTRRSFMANADFSRMVKAYRTMNYFNSFADISETALKEEYVDAIPHTDLVKDLSVLKFYKTNKPIKTGELLRLSDLNAINLVKAGLKTEVILENQMIRIKTQGISRGNGTLGELVEVFHPQKNKRYQGKVVDLNKVLVEL